MGIICWYWMVNLVISHGKWLICINKSRWKQLHSEKQYIFERRLRSPAILFIVDILRLLCSAIHQEAKHITCSVRGSRLFRGDASKKEESRACWSPWEYRWWTVILYRFEVMDVATTLLHSTLRFPYNIGNLPDSKRFHSAVVYVLRPVFTL